eukprot:6528599-Prorocentrum_lima.AAC.1
MVASSGSRTAHVMRLQWKSWKQSGITRRSFVPMRMYCPCMWSYTRACNRKAEQAALSSNRPPWLTRPVTSSMYWSTSVKGVPHA